MIEFPRKARPVSQSEPSEAALPAWRVELNERVRAIKARRDNSASEADMISATAHGVTEMERGTLAVRQEEVRSRVRPSSARVASAIAAEAIQEDFNHPEPSLQPARPTRSSGRANDSIVEAALTRVRRASENASRAALPKIEPARNGQQATNGSLAVDKEATARALEPATEVRQRPTPMPIPLQQVSQPRVIRPEPVEDLPPFPSPPVPAMPEAKPSPQFQDLITSTNKAPVDSPKTIVLDEIEPMDYLEAEIRKVDQVLSKEFAKNESPSLATHLVLNIVDLIVIALSCSPFLALTMISNGSLEIIQTRVAMGGIIALVVFLYFSLTQCLCGKTFGMMFTGTCILEARTSEPPSPQRALIRSAGYFVAAAPALLGLLWAAIDRKHRGWQDLISGTFVAHDF